MSTYQLSCTIGSTNPSAKLGFEVWIEDQQIFNSDYITEETLLTFDIDEDEDDHELRFVMKNKTVEHTQVDFSGNIVTDARLIISDVAFDEIKLGQIFIDHAEYTHDFNGTQSEITEKFYGEMGCNGTVSLRFTTPIYLWLLEHM